MKKDRNTKQSRLFMVAVALVALSSFVQTSAFAASKLIVQDNSTPAVDKFVVTDTGAIGVGTNMPTTAIQVRGITNAGVQIMSSYTGAESYVGGGFVAYHNNPLAINSGMPIAGDKVGYMLFGSFGTNGVAPKNSAGLVAYAESNWTDTNIPSYFLFETAPPNSTTRLERMRITSTGNIGIATSTPTQKLEVNGGIRLNTATVKPACDTNSRGTIWFTSAAVGAADKLEVCAKDATENYDWKPLF